MVDIYSRSHVWMSEAGQSEVLDRSVRVQEAAAARESEKYVQLEKSV